MSTESPLTFSVHDLSREPGSARTIETTLGAPETFGTSDIGIAAGQDIDLDLRLESVSDGVLVTGTVAASLKTACVRCLDPVAQDLAVDLVELYYHPEVRARLISDGDEDAEESAVVEGEAVDVLPLVRDGLVLSLPFQPLCRPDCPGLCAQCGIRLADAEPGHAHEQKDPRWAVLEGFFDDDGGNAHADGGRE